MLSGALTILEGGNAGVYFLTSVSQEPVLNDSLTFLPVGGLRVPKLPIHSSTSEFHTKFILLLFCFFDFETGPHCVALTGLKLAVYARLVSNLKEVQLLLPPRPN